MVVPTTFIRVPRRTYTHSNELIQLQNPWTICPFPGFSKNQLKGFFFLLYMFLVCGFEAVIVNWIWMENVKKERDGMIVSMHADGATCGRPAWIGKRLTCVCFKRKGVYEGICFNITPKQASTMINFLISYVIPTFNFLEDPLCVCNIFEYEYRSRLRFYILHITYLRWYTHLWVWAT